MCTVLLRRQKASFSGFSLDQPPPPVFIVRSFAHPRRCDRCTRVGRSTRRAVGTSPPQRSFVRFCIRLKVACEHTRPFWRTFGTNRKRVSSVPFSLSTSDHRPPTRSERVAGSIGTNAFMKSVFSHRETIVFRNIHPKIRNSIFRCYYRREQAVGNSSFLRLFIVLLRAVSLIDRTTRVGSF